MTASNVLTEELEAIKAIYGDDYLQIKTKSVWGVSVCSFEHDLRR